MKIFKIINSKIRNKLIFGFVFISLFVGVVGYIGFSTIKKIERDYYLISTKTLPLIKHLKDMKFACLRLVSSASEYAYIQTESGNTSEVSPLEQEDNLIFQSCNSCHDAFTQYNRLVKESFPELVEDSKEIRNNGDQLHIIALEFIEMKKQKISGFEALEKKEEMEASEMKFLEKVEHSINHTNGNLEKEKIQLVSTISSSITKILLFSGLTFLISVLIGVLYSRSISKPIIKLTQLTDDFGKGNLDAKIEIKTIDEIGVLSSAFNNMAYALKTSTSKLQIEKIRFQQLYENIPLGIVLLSKDNNVISINKAFQSLFKYSPEEIKGMSIDKLIVPPQYSEEAISLSKDALTAIANKETIRKQKDGSLIHVHVYGVPILFGGEIVGSYGLYQDITMRKQSEEILRFQNEIMANINEAVFLARLEDNVIVYANSNFEKMFGYEKNELLGKHSSIVNSPTDKSPEESAKEILDSILENNIWRGEVNNIKKDGTSFWCYTNISVFDHSVFGKVFIASHTDITERKRADLEHQVLYDITQSITTSSNLDELLNLMYRSLKKVIYAENCFVALRDPITCLYNFPFYIDKFDPKPEPLAMDKSCSAYIFRTNKSLLLSQKLFDELVDQNEVELVGTNAPSWVGVPLQTPTGTIGVLVLQHYEKENAYNEHDVEFLESIGNQIAIVIERKKAEEALLESQSLYYSFIEQLPNAVFRKDRNGRYVLVNSEFCRLKGLAKEDIIGRTPKEVAEREINKFGDHGQSVKYANLGVDIQNQILKSGKIYESEEEYPDADGSTQFMSVVRMPVFDSSNTIIGTQGIMFDITSRKKAEAELRESEIKLNVILESTADGILAVDSKGKIIKTNKRFVELWGIPKFLIGSEDDNALLNFVLDQLIEPEEFIFKVKILYNSTEEDLDLLHFKDGKIFERFSTPLLMPDSSIGRVWSFRDITERMGAIERLRESEDRFRNLVENISDVFFIADEDGKMFYCSPNFFTQTQFSAQDTYGKSYIRFVVPEDRKKVLDFYAEQSKNNVLDVKIDLRALIKDGTFLWVEQNTRFIRDSNGKVKQYRVVVRDITERKRWEEEVKKHNEQLSKLIAEKDKFFSIVAHDLRSPFNGFLNLTKIMATQSKDLTISEFAKFSMALNDSAINIYKLIENLLEWAMMQQGKMEFNLQNQNLYKMVSQSLSTISDRAAQKSISIINRVDESILVLADEKMINTVLRNLLSNAIKFTRKDGTVEIHSALSSNGLIEISIKDSGVGISETNLNRLFKIGEKVSTKGTDNEPSTGLGLLLCKEFVEKNGGRIWTESQEGKGSTFTFSLNHANNNLL